jgi:hypothetical protein
MPTKNYRDLSDAEIQAKLRQICAESTTEQEIRDKLRDELGYSYHAAIDTHMPTDAVGRSAQAIVRGLGGPLMKSGAMVMMMIHGPRGNTITL